MMPAGKLARRAKMNEPRDPVAPVSSCRQLTGPAKLAYGMVGIRDGVLTIVFPRDCELEEGSARACWVASEKAPYLLARLSISCRFAAVWSVGDLPSCRSWMCRESLDMSLTCYNEACSRHALLEGRLLEDDIDW